MLVVITSHYKVKEVNDAEAMIEVLIQEEENMYSLISFCISVYRGLLLKSDAYFADRLLHSHS